MMDIEERQLKELAWLYFYFAKQGKKGITVDALTLFHQFRDAGVDIGENELVLDLEDLRDEGYIGMKELEGQGNIDIRIENVTLQGKNIITDPLSIDTNNNIMNMININSIQGNNNTSSQSNVSNNILNIPDEKIEQIEKQIDKIQASLEISNTESKKHFDDLKEQLRQKNKKGIENGIKSILNLGISTINNANAFVSFISAIHGLSCLL